MTGVSWGCAALLCWHLGFGGALPREVRPESVVSYVAGRAQVRVLVFGGASQVRVSAGPALAIEDAASGSRLAMIEQGGAATVQACGDRVSLQTGRVRLVRDALILRPRDGEGAAVLSGRGGWGARGSYPGALELSARGNRLSVVESVGLEDYVAGVVAAEMPADFPLEAMKAQAIAARTYALFHLGDHRVDGADLCARVHCQAYRGAPPAGSRAARASRETAGQVLAWNGVLVDALYHSACGGATARAWEVRQGKILPYLRGGSDTDPWGAAYCARGHNVGWTKHFSFAEASRLVAANLPTVRADPSLSPGPLEWLRPIAGRPGGRVQWLEVKTREGAFLVRGDSIRWLFGSGFAGPEGLRSTAFSLSVEEDAAGRPRAFTFEGKGHGHGIGLCQWGARGRAEAGQSAAEILAAYYPGAEIVSLGEP